MPRVPSPTPYALTALLAVGACEDDRSRCLETRRVIAYAEITADGSSAESLMHTMAGEFAGVLTWNGGADIVQVTPPAGATTLELSLTHAGGDVELIERAPHDVAPGERLACDDDLVIPAVLTLETADGGLRGRWDVAAVHTLGSASLGVMLRPFGPGNDGSFAAALLRPDEWDPGTEEIFLAGAFDVTGAAGDITLTASRTLPDEGELENGAGLVGRLATWSLPRP